MPIPELDLPDLYRLLLDFFGPQHWWPGDTPVEIMAGAILTQNTSWINVERAIANLKRRRMLSIRKLASSVPSELAELIRPAGYFNIKAVRLISFFQWFADEIGPTVRSAPHFSTEVLRLRMISEVNGIGPETADSILLYALGRPVFVIDAYTRRILARHGMPEAVSMGYSDLQQFFHDLLPRDVALFNEFHALFVAAGKLCRKSNPRCAHCPLVNSVLLQAPGDAHET